jgi:hypothetical protein
LTAQIAILNKTAIALASDSAVTVESGGKSKIFTSANKLFRLSRNHPVGIMIYGNAELVGIPWEAIIKTYRENLGHKEFDILSEYADDFIKFLDNNGFSIFSASAQERFIMSSIYSYFNYVERLIEDRVRSIIEKNGSIEENRIKKILVSVIGSNHKMWEQTPKLETLPGDFIVTILSKYRANIDKAIRAVFESLPLTDNNRSQLRHIAAQICTKKLPEQIEHTEISGIVIAGFGAKQIFPSLKSYNIDGMVENRLRYWIHEEISIGNEPNTSTSSIIPFAQDDMVISFIEGINPFYRRTQERLFSEAFKLYQDESIELAKSCGCNQPEDTKRLHGELNKLTRKIKKTLEKMLSEYRRSTFIDPTITVVEMLPKDELAAMAESLVNLTSFQRKVSLQAETVGGAIDVAVISKGDGFVWIKRKLYFDPNLNPGFIANYYRGGQYEKQEIKK